MKVRCGRGRRWVIGKTDVGMLIRVLSKLCGPLPLTHSRQRPWLYTITALQTSSKFCVLWDNTGFIVPMPWRPFRSPSAACSYRAAQICQQLNRSPVYLACVCSIYGFKRSPSKCHPRILYAMDDPQSSFRYHVVATGLSSLFAALAIAVVLGVR